MGTRAEYFIDGMVRMLARVRPRFNELPQETQHMLAGLIWQASNKSRQHSGYAGAVFFTYQELEKKFGRCKFLLINEMVNMFEVLGDDYLKQHTRGYRLHPDIKKAQHNMLKHIRTHRPVVRLLLEDGRYMQKIPKAVASKDSDGITATAWDGAKELEPTPIDMARLTELMQWLERQIKVNTADMFSAIDPVRGKPCRLGQGQERGRQGRPCAGFSVVSVVAQCTGG